MKKLTLTETGMILDAKTLKSFKENGWEIVQVKGRKRA